MSELYILRHCKSDWDGSFSQDSDRVLSERGLSDAAKLGAWMKQQGYQPGYILCSTAVRAQQTIQIVCQQLGIADSDIHYKSELYLAGLNRLLTTVTDNRDKPGPLLLVGHNPGMDELVTYLASSEVPLTNQGKLMTTGCLARFKLPDQNQGLQNQAELLSITRPSEI